MRLAIADPPYLGRGAMLYGPNAVTFPDDIGGRVHRRTQSGDHHTDAAEWDDPQTHRLLSLRLNLDYDGFAIAMNPDNLAAYLSWLPDARVAAWVKPNPFPAGHVVRSWEPVLLQLPDRSRARDRQARDSLVANKPSAPTHKFMGRKPPAWTRWVLDMLGYDPDTDTVDDLFGGSGAVTAEINQGVLL